MILDGSEAHHCRIGLPITTASATAERRFVDDFHVALPIVS
jgi:hypothetical protein